MKKWFVLALVISSASAALAQTALETEKKPLVTQKQDKEEVAKPAPVAAMKSEPKNPAALKFSMGMLESGRIDPGYAGISVADVVDAIEKMTGTKKGEFESTADYNVRKAAALKAKFLGDYSVDDTFAFVVSVSNRGKYGKGLKYYFNADTSDVSLYVLPESSEIPLNGIGSPNYQANLRESKGLDQFMLSTKIESNSIDQIHSASGATVAVKKTNSSNFGVAASRIPFLKFKRDLVYSNPMVASQFKLENSRATQELPALKALIVMKLADPYVVYNFVRIKPTRASPSEFSIQEKFLTGNVIGVVFYSGLTGDIFARLPGTFGKPEPKVEGRHEDKHVRQ